MPTSKLGLSPKSVTRRSDRVVAAYTDAETFYGFASYSVKYKNNININNNNNKNNHNNKNNDDENVIFESSQ